MTEASSGRSVEERCAIREEMVEEDLESVKVYKRGMEKSAEEKDGDDENDDEDDELSYLTVIPWKYGHRRSSMLLDEDEGPAPAKSTEPSAVSLDDSDRCTVVEDDDECNTSDIVSTGSVSSNSTDSDVELCPDDEAYKVAAINLLLRDDSISVEMMRSLHQTLSEESKSRTSSFD